ncbi:MAG: sodium:proton antiporter [Pseudomonadota bacterium]
MTLFQILAIILTLTAIGAYLNHRFVKLPPSIGHMAFALLVSLAVVVLSELNILNLKEVAAIIIQIDFSAVLLHGMLSVLLFAGALHINWNDLKNARIPVVVLATLGVVIATFVTGTITWWGANLIGINLPYMYALIFGALISPTDPIAVLSILKKAGASQSLYAKTGGESLFNDGVGVVVFMVILTMIASPGDISFLHITKLFAWETLGGALLGGALGWLTYCMLRPINEYQTEVLLTLALVVGGYAFAEYVHVSAPICMVVAGLIIGNQGRSHGMSDETREHIDVFWELLDEIFNAVLFLLVGLVIIVITVTGNVMWLGGIAIAAVLVGRLVSVGLPISLMRIWRPFNKGTIRALTWGGLRGGVSIALALSLPLGPEKDIILPITYMVVLFSILVQGLTFRKVLTIVYKAS